MKVDSIALSAIWGRVGAVICAALAILLGLLGYNMDEADQKALYDLISMIFTAVAGFLALVSKIREAKKVKVGV